MPRHRRTDLDALADRIAREYLDGDDVKTLGRRYRASTTAITARLVDAGVELRGKGWAVQTAWVERPIRPVEITEQAWEWSTSTPRGTLCDL